MKKATMKDIAIQANVSVATVSYVLNNVANQTIPTHTRDLILSVAKELNYVPNLAARSLIKRKSGLVGILVSRSKDEPMWKTFRYQSLLTNLERRLTEAGYHTLLISIDVEQPSLDVIVERKLEAVFLIEVKDDMFYNISSLFVEGVPLILIDGLIDDPLFNHVLFNFERVFEQLHSTITDSTVLFVEQFHNKALLKYIIQHTSIPSEHIYVVNNITQLDEYLTTLTIKSAIVINEFLANYITHRQPSADITTICTAHCPQLLSPHTKRITFLDDGSELAFSLMTSLISNNFHASKSNKFFVNII